MSSLDGLALGRRRRRRRLSHGRLRGRELGRRVRGLRVAGDRVLELAHPVPERFPDLRQPLTAEQEQRDREEDDDVPGLQVTHVSTESSAFAGTWTGRRTLSLDLSSLGVRGESPAIFGKEAYSIGIAQAGKSARIARG